MPFSERRLDVGLHLITGPPGPGLTHRLFEEYLARSRTPGTCLWLAPTRRAAEEIVHRIGRSGQPRLAPQVFTFSALAQAVLAHAFPDRPNLSAAARQRLVEEVAGDLARRARLGYFRRVAGTRGFLDAAGGLLTELEALGLSPDDLGAAGGGPRAEKHAACAAFASEFARRAPGCWDRLRQAARIISAGLPRPVQRVRFVFLDGVPSYSPAEWALVEALAPLAETWISLPVDTSGRAEAFAAVHRARARLTPVFGSAQSETGATGEPRPAGLAHLAGHLFGPAVEQASDAAGLSVIEAAGPVGEARLAARRIRSLLAEGVRAERIVITARDLTHSADLLAEVFAEYGLPVELERDESLLRSPAVAALLRALRLPDEGWPFAGVTALLRSTYFRPLWPDGGADTARRAEGLLRLLGEPRDREAYLRAVLVWSEAPPDGLEDEQAEESRRLRKARLAAECRPFLERFFRAWDGLPPSATAADFAAHVRAFAEDIGLSGTSAGGPTRPVGALDALWSVAAWDGPSVSRTAYLRALTTGAAAEALPAPRLTGGRVRIVPAQEARHVDCDYLFVLGLGEKSFPRLAPPVSLLDDADRAILRQASLPFPDPGARLGEEQLLFLQLVACPRCALVLGFPAVDEKGQPLLPGSFLRAVRECFAPSAIPVERQRMLIEGYTTREPQSLAEARVQFAAAMRGSEDGWRHPGLPAGLCEHLRWADGVAADRFRARDYNRYDGWLHHPAARAAVHDRFGPAHVFSPTALEAYIACPFRFLLGHVLGLEELDEPGEEVEHTRRGAAYHRALARLHNQLGADADLTKGVLPETVGEQLFAELDRAVAEYAARAPSRASRRLWELEGQRLRRSAVKYRGHWDCFLDPWRKASARLTPQLLEADFGLTTTSQVQTVTETGGPAPLIVSVGGVEVRIGGRIDRVDVADLAGELGFWVIDYKTGRAANYTAAELARFEKLQLPLYALAVERVFFPGRKARPLGLAYWLVTDTGPKPVLPARQSLAWLADTKKWATFRAQLEAWVAKLVGRIREGQFPLAPRSINCTETCSFGEICRITQSRNTGKVWELSLPAADDANEADPTL